jgi:dihydrofolate reductase
MQISAIFATDSSGVIGRAGKVPWNIPEDMRWFRRHTLGKTLLMGRKTFDDIGKPLPRRVNIVASRSQSTFPSGVIRVGGIEEGIEYARESAVDELMVIGGAQIYSASFSLCSKLYRTTICDNFEGDTFFPLYEKEEWVVLEHSEILCEGRKVVFEILARRDLNRLR